MKTLNKINNFLALDEKYSNFTDSKIVILPAPYEHSTSYGKGAAAAPEAILNASAFVEFYDDDFDTELCFSKGIATLEPLDFNGKFDKIAIDFLQSEIEKILDFDKFVVTLGGEHTISIAPIAAHFKKYPNMSILHFDAHSDLREKYSPEENEETDSLYSHACFMRRVCEFFPPEKITQVGIRAQCKEEAEFIKINHIKTFYAGKIRRSYYGDNWLKSVVDSLSEQIYITFDVDYFDPSVIPATGTPEPNGFYYSETLDLFWEILKSGKKIIGFDMVELAPMTGLEHPNLTTARLIYKILNFAF